MSRLRGLEQRIAGFFDLEGRAEALRRRVSASPETWDRKRYASAYTLAHFYLLREQLAYGGEAATASDREKVDDYYRGIELLKKQVQGLRKLSEKFRDHEVSTTLRAVEQFLPTESTLSRHRAVLKLLAGPRGKGGASPRILAIKYVQAKWPRAVLAAEITTKIEESLEDYGLGNLAKSFPDQWKALLKSVEQNLSRLNPKRTLKKSRTKARRPRARTCR